jgi:hypothetical protein
MIPRESETYRRTGAEGIGLGYYSPVESGDKE